MFHDLARSGASSRFWSRSSRRSKRRKSTCAENASVPMRGSRLVGMASRRKFTVREPVREPVRAHPDAKRKQETMAIRYAMVLARTGIADFPKDGRMARACGAGEIVGAPAKRFVAENSEREGFFGIGWNAESVRRNEVQQRKKRGEISNEQRIACAAAGEDEFADADARGNKILNGASDGSGGECGCGVEQIGRTNPFAAGASYELGGVFSAEFFAAGGFWRGFAEERMIEESIQKFRMQMTAASELRIAIEAQAAASELCGEGVQDHVARAGVEGDHVARLCAGGNHGEIGDAADV